MFTWYTIQNTELNFTEFALKLAEQLKRNVTKMHSLCFIDRKFTTINQTKMRIFWNV